MGIHGLTKVIGDHAPGAIKEADIKTFFGRKVAVDASMSIYQFLIAVRQQDGQQLVNDAGETTSHLMGLFYRTIRMAENGIKVLYCFDGKPPDMKSSELAKRGEKRQEAQNAVDAATEAGDVENIQKFEKRTVKVTKEHNQECQKLLGLMGIPYVISPGEAEAQCASLAKAGIVYAAGSEDMDTLTFNSPFLLRHLTFSEARKMPIMEISLEKVLEGLEFTMDQFIDLCILLGCDYCDSIRGIGPSRAVQLLKDYGSIEGVIKSLDPKKYKIPEDWPFEEARKLFKNPLVTDPKELEIKWTDPDEEGLVQFLCKEKHFNEDRVRKAVQKFAKAKASGTQGRLDSFFKILPKSSDAKSVPKSSEAKKTNARKGDVGGKPKKKKK